jgi:murein L,D-transpeptidase YcbB/YkuD
VPVWFSSLSALTSEVTAMEAAHVTDVKTRFDAIYQYIVDHAYVCYFKAETRDCWRGVAKEQHVAYQLAEAALATFKSLDRSEAEYEKKLREKTDARDKAKKEFEDAEKKCREPATGK